MERCKEFETRRCDPTADRPYMKYVNERDRDDVAAQRGTKSDLRLGFGAHSQAPDLLWYPTIGRSRIRAFRQTPWGGLFEGC